MNRPDYLKLKKNRVNEKDYLRGMPYSNWHRSLDHRLMAQDIDFVEFRSTPNGIVPVAIIETTRVDGTQPVSQNYLNNIIDRYRNWSLKQVAINSVTEGLGVPAYIVLFRENCKEFWINDFSDGSNDWTNVNAQQMEEFLQSL